jgi:hypothetical protein
LQDHAAFVASGIDARPEPSFLKVGGSSGSLVGLIGGRCHLEACVTAAG